MESAPNAVRLDTEANTAAPHMTKARPKARRESRDVMQRVSEDRVSLRERNEEKRNTLRDTELEIEDPDIPGVLGKL